MLLFKPAEKSGQARKFARPFHGPYRVVEVDSNTAKIRRVDQPDEELILVALESLRPCPEEVGDECWPPVKSTRWSRSKQIVRNAAETTESPAGQALQSGTGSFQEPGTSPTCEGSGDSGLEGEVSGDSGLEGEVSGDSGLE